MGSGDGHDGVTTLTGNDWYVSSCNVMNNNHWNNVMAYIGNTTEIADATFCGYVSEEIVYNEDDLTLGDEDTIIDLMKVGGSVKCPETVGSSQYVILYFSNPYAY